tara:strand:- start:588 stop:854 length:267 start_codon:yes stop_codon:yes gene_type:complete
VSGTSRKQQKGASTCNHSPGHAPSHRTNKEKWWIIVRDASGKILIRKAGRQPNEVMARHAVAREGDIVLYEYFGRLKGAEGIARRYQR